MVRLSVTVPEGTEPVMVPGVVKVLPCQSSRKKPIVPATGGSTGVIMVVVSVVVVEVVPGALLFLQENRMPDKIPERAPKKTYLKKNRFITYGFKERGPSPVIGSSRS
jgi:hypothetical protein